MLNMNSPFLGQLKTADIMRAWIFDITFDSFHVLENEVPEIFDRTRVPIYKTFT